MELVLSCLYGVLKVKSRMTGLLSQPLFPVNHLASPISGKPSSSHSVVVSPHFPGYFGCQPYIVLTDCLLRSYMLLFHRDIVKCLDYLTSKAEMMKKE